MHLDLYGMQEDGGSDREGGARGGPGGTSGGEGLPKAGKKKAADGTSGNGNAVGPIRDDQCDHTFNSSLYHK